MRTMFTAVVIAVAVAGFAFADAGQYASWADGPVKHLITPPELAEWKAVRNEEEAKAFIDLFWAKRDPTPGTPQNELRTEFETRVKLADEYFSTKRTSGAMSDRGRTMILLGSPARVGDRGPQSGAPRNPNFRSVDQWDGGVRGPRGASAMLTWTYSGDKKPKFVNRKDFAIVFVDDAGDGEYLIATTDRVHHEAIFAEAARAFILHPELKSAAFETPVIKSKVTTLRDAQLQSAYEKFQNEAKKSEGPALLTWGQFVTPDGEIFVPVQLFVPAGGGIEAGRKVTFFGVVENVAREIVSVFEEPVTLAASLRDAYVDKSLTLQPGTYKATVGLAENGNVLAMSTTNMTIEALDPKESSISQLILSNNAFALAEAQLLTDPFAFGGLKVVPKADALFSTKDDIWYFFELRNPGIGDTGAPKIQAKIDMERKDDQNNTVKKMSLPWQEIETLALKGVKDHYGLGMSFPLKDFVPGRYTVKIRVLDSVLKKTYEAETEFRVQM